MTRVFQEELMGLFDWCVKSFPFSLRQAKSKLAVNQEKKKAVRFEGQVKTLNQKVNDLTKAKQTADKAAQQVRLEPSCLCIINFSHIL